MFLFILFILSSIIIFRFLDKKMMKIASICYVVMTILLSTYLVINIFSLEGYELLKDALINTNVIIFVETLVIILFIIAIVIEVIKLKTIKEKVERKERVIIDIDNIEVKHKTKEIKIKEGYVYLKYCRLLN